jgi:hypothetical protein
LRLIVQHYTGLVLDRVYAVQDVDQRLARRLWTHWHPHADFDEVSDNWLAMSSLVHGRHQVNKPEEMGNDIKFEEQLSTDLNTLQIFLYKDVLPVWDAVQKQTTTVSIEGIYLMATSPANDPLVFLRSIAENVINTHTLTLAGLVVFTMFCFCKNNKRHHHHSPVQYTPPPTRTAYNKPSIRCLCVDQVHTVW